MTDYGKNTNIETSTDEIMQRLCWALRHLSLLASSYHILTNKQKLASPLNINDEVKKEVPHPHQ